MTVLTLDDFTRKQLIALAAIPSTDDHTEACTGIRFAGHEATATDRYSVGIVELSWTVEEPRLVPAKPLASALKMASKEEMARIIFGDRQAVVTVGSPTLPLYDPDEDEGLPPIAVDLTYLEDDGWPVDGIAKMQTARYEQPVDRRHVIVNADRLAKLAKVGATDELRLSSPAAGGAWQVTTPYSRHVIGYLIVSEVTGEANR